MKKNHDDNVFCALPFTYVYIDSQNEYKLCSDATLSSKISAEKKSVLEYYNSDYINRIRNDMIDYNITPEIRKICSRCIEREELNLWSRRQGKVDEITLKNFQSENLVIPTSKTIKIKFGNICNLRCLYCGPYSSSRWVTLEQQIKKNKDHDFELLKEKIDIISRKKYNISFLRNEYGIPEIHSHNMTKMFYEEFFIYGKNVENIIISGGEPFLSEYFYEFLEWLITNKISNKINLYVFSNGMQLPKNFKRYYNKFKNFVINISIDGVGKKDEYLRTGTIFEKKDEVITTLSKYFIIDFCVTTSMLNVGYQREMIDYCKKFNKKPNFHNQLIEPFYLQVNNLPKDIIDFYIIKKEYHPLFFSEQSDHEIFMLGISYLKKFDQYNNTNLIEIWPEFKKYYEEI